MSNSPADGSNSSAEGVPANQVAAGTTVAARLDGRRTLCLKLEREGKDHTNHFLLPLDPVDDRRVLALVYIDPDVPVTVVDGVSLVFSDAAGDAPEVGDAFATASGVYFKVADRPQSQRLHAYVEIASGQVRPRMERHFTKLLAWHVQRL